ncbi:MAG: sigma-54 dependent transcriptional regulator [Sphaerochaetaceae bacterium]|jgi:DNA-binding NtrC family response regulator
MRRTILIADDEKNIRSGLQIALEDENFNVLLAADGNEAWKIITTNSVDLLISDLRMPGMNGQELLKRVISNYPTMPVVILTGHGTIEAAVEAMRNGAVDFMTKPLNLDRLFLLIKRAFSNLDLYDQNAALKKELAELKRQSGYDKIIGKSNKMRRLLETIAQVADATASVLITGESGVGKELVADALHHQSSRSEGPFIKVSCATFAETLLEDELFGHEKGAFSGAISSRKGRFELAHGGTLFLDEIGELSSSTQVKLLRVLQERQFERLGGEKTITVDVRLVAATNRNLLAEVEAGRFREDLFYRLNVIHIDVPPLRERREDIPLLLSHFLDLYNKRNNRNVEGFTQQAKSALLSYDWPGNIRELGNYVESMVVLATKSIIDIDDLPQSVRSSKEEQQVIIPLGATMQEAEKSMIMATVAHCGGNKSKAADTLNIARKTLHRKLKEYQIGTL